MKKETIIRILFVACLITACIKGAKAQTHCSKDRLFIAEVKAEMPIAYVDVPAVSFGVGVSGIYGKGTVLDNMSALAGIKWIREVQTDKRTNERMAAIPTATIMYKIRLNGESSKTVHAFAMTAGPDKKYYGFDYRAYLVNINDPFTVGFIAGWNNQLRYNIGFTMIGFF